MPLTYKNKTFYFENPCFYKELMKDGTPKKSVLKGTKLGLYMGVWAEPSRLSRFMSSLFK